jgi:hypothetical protein
MVQPVTLIGCGSNFHERPRVSTVSSDSTSAPTKETQLDQLGNRRILLCQISERVIHGNHIGRSPGAIGPIEIGILTLQVATSLRSPCEQGKTAMNEDQLAS